MMQTQEVLELLGLSVTISDPTNHLQLPFALCAFMGGQSSDGHKGGNSMAGMKTGSDPQTLSEI